MARKSVKSCLFLFLLLSLLNLGSPAQTGTSTPRSQEISEDDGLPVIIKHLPEWQSVQSSTVFITGPEDLRRALGDRPVFNAIEFSPGTEAVKADYPAGKLLIVEFVNPHFSIDADGKVLQFLAANPDPTTVYRRIGNYSVFVLDASDSEDAVRLLDQVKYEKRVQWLGEDPYLLQKIERYFAVTTRDILVSTVLWISGGLGLAAILGVIFGLIFFRIREQKRATWSAYTDAGGMTRLNLDELSE